MMDITDMNNETGLEQLRDMGMSGREWKSYVFTDFVDVNPKVSMKGNEIYPFIEMKDLNPDFKSVHSVSERMLSGGARFQNGDTLFARITPCLENGKIAQVQGLQKDRGFGSTEFLVFRGKEGISNSDFVYYLSRTDFVRGFAEQNLLGTSGRQRVSKEAFDNLEILVPGLDEQTEIASILSSLDDKIELNRQMNQTLEAMAQALFQEWFVDFRFPGATGELVESELGMIPKGWRVGTLGELFNITMGQSPPGESYNEAGIGIAFFQGRADFNFRFPSKRVYTTEPKRFAKKLDTLVSVRAPVGDMNVASEDCCIGRGLAAVISKTNQPSFTFYFLKRLTEKFKDFEGSGTVFGSINKVSFEGMSCIIPEPETINAFEATCRPIDDLILTNEEAIRALGAVRDGLLPRLMQGRPN